jgi:hypothetical protein
MQAVDDNVRRVSLEMHWRAKSFETMRVEKPEAVRPDIPRRSEDLGGDLHCLYS